MIFHILKHRSIVAALVGTLVLRIASAAMGSMIQLYFGYIDRSVYPLSATMRGVALAIFFLPELIFSPVFGAWSDRYGRKWFMGLGALLGGLSAQMAALTTHFGALVFVRWLAGLATACGLPATLGLLSAETAQDESLRGRVMGLFQLVTIGGTIIGILIGGRLWDLFHAQAFTLNHAIYLLSLLVFVLGIRETLSLRKRRTHAMVHGARALRRAFNYYREALLAPEVLRFAPAWLTINILLGVWLNQIVGQLLAPRERFPHQLLYGILSEQNNAGTQIALAALGFAVLFVLGIIGWSWVLGKIRRTTVMLIASGGIPSLCTVLFALNHRPALDDPLVPVLVMLALVMLTVVSGIMPATLTYLADVTEMRVNDRGAIMGLYTIFFGAGQFLGTLLGGPFADWAAIDGILFLTSGLGIITAVLLFRLHRAETAVWIPETITVKDDE